MLVDTARWGKEPFSCSWPCTQLTSMWRANAGQFVAASTVVCVIWELPFTVNNACYSVRALATVAPLRVLKPQFTFYSCPSSVDSEQYLNQTSAIRRLSLLKLSHREALFKVSNLIPPASSLFSLAWPWLMCNRGNMTVDILKHSQTLSRPLPPSVRLPGILGPSDWRAPWRSGHAQCFIATFSPWYRVLLFFPSRYRVLTGYRPPSDTIRDIISRALCLLRWHEFTGSLQLRFFII